MPELPRQSMREITSLGLARFILRHRRPLALLMALGTLLCAYPLANALFAAAGHRLPGPTVQFKSFAWPHHTDPRRPHTEPHRSGHRA